MLSKVGTYTYREAAFCHDAPRLWISRPEDLRIPLNIDWTQAPPLQSGFWLIFYLWWFYRFGHCHLFISVFFRSLIFNYFLSLPIFNIYYLSYSYHCIYYFVFNTWFLCFYFTFRPPFIYCFIPYCVVSLTTFHSCFFPHFSACSLICF